jgi:hypothetical protein
MNCCVVPGAIDGLAGVTAIETSPAFTVRLAVPVTLPSFALMVLAPAALAVTIPVDAAVTAALDELQVTLLVRSCVGPLL